MGKSYAVLLDDVYGTTTNTIRSNTLAHSNFEGSPILYEVINVRSGSKIRQYLVHYNGWSEERVTSVFWDEWLGVEYLNKYNDDNVHHFNCKKLILKKDIKAAQESEIIRKKMNNAENCKKLKKRLCQEEKKTKQLKQMLRTLSTLLPKPTAASGHLVDAAQAPAPLQQVPTMEVVDITEEEPVGTPRKPNERLRVEPEAVTTDAADLSKSWISLFGPNVDLSNPIVWADLLQLIGLPKETAEQELKTHEEVLLSSVDHSLRLCKGAVHHLKQLLKEKEELEKKLREKCFVVDKLAQHFTRQFRKLLSERRAMEETLEKKEKVWEAQEADWQTQLEVFKVEAICLQSVLNGMKVQFCNELMRYQSALIKRIKVQYPEVDLSFLDSWEFGVKELDSKGEDE